MATGTSKAPAYTAEASSTEVMELIPGKIKVTYIRDIYIKSEIEQNFFCNVKHLTCLNKSRLVVVDDAVSTESRFAFSAPEAGKFRVKLVDTTGKQVVSVLDVPGKFSGMTTISDTQLALCVDGNKIVLLRADKTLTAERSVKFPNAHDNEKYDIPHLSTYKDDVYISNGRNISKVDIMGKTTKVFESTLRESRWSYLRYSQYYIASVMYTDGNKTFMYAITCDVRYDIDQVNKPYLAHGTGTSEVMDKIKTLAPGEPRFIIIDDEFELLFVLLFVNQTRDKEEYYMIYVLRPGSTNGCVLLGEADGLQDVTSMAYCSKTRQLFVGFKENNYVKVYQLSSVP